jgi:hypothetical protein
MNRLDVTKRLRSPLYAFLLFTLPTACMSGDGGGGAGPAPTSGTQPDVGGSPSVTSNRSTASPNGSASLDGSVVPALPTKETVCVADGLLYYVSADPECDGLECGELCKPLSDLDGGVKTADSDVHWCNRRSKCVRSQD